MLNFKIYRLQSETNRTAWWWMWLREKGWNISANKQQNGFILFQRFFFAMSSVSNRLIVRNFNNYVNADENPSPDNLSRLAAHDRSSLRQSSRRVLAKNKWRGRKSASIIRSDSHTTAYRHTCGAFLWVLKKDRQEKRRFPLKKKL